MKSSMDATEMGGVFLSYTGLSRIYQAMYIFMIEGKELILLGDQIKLVPFAPYVDNYFRWFNDPEVRKYLASTTPRNREEIDDWIKELAQTSSNAYFSITVGEQNIGHIGLKNINLEAGTADLGIVIGEAQYWGKGIGKQAVDAIQKYATETLGLTQLTALVVNANSRSVALFTDCGFDAVSHNQETTNFSVRL